VRRRSRKAIFWIGFILVLACFIFIYKSGFRTEPGPETPEAGRKHALQRIESKLGRGESLSTIFRKHGLDMAELAEIKKTSAGVYSVASLRAGRRYRITIDDARRVDSFVYWVDDESFLRVTRKGSGFVSEMAEIPYESRVVTLSGTVEDNLVSSIGEGREHVLLALKVSDVFAWDIDFSSDLRDGDTFTIIAEGLYLNGEFVRFGEVLSAEFVNDGSRYRAYRFERNGRADYFNAEGKSLRKAFLKAPLSFRRISSSFSLRRFHPVLRTYRPHRGVDYAAAAGTPVSATGDGTVIFAGYQGQYGRLVVLRHRNGFKTYYGHLSRIERRVRRGVQAAQGDVIGYVGATGLATGPHLHYEVRQEGKHVNPLALRQHGGEPVPAGFMTAFGNAVKAMDRIYVSPNGGDAKVSGLDREMLR